ncbi:hypothetical protein [Herbaspirillum sp.]|uniref:hypothetical protein n=1 Tax=Herbaspirillum sp. TaxID=1890675 RepID=UPI00257D8680|nr:hypothetical protein [Herbaspirillum sp.]
MREDLQTGDLVGCSGRGLFSSIVKMTGPWSHVGLIYRLHDRVFLWESTTLSDLRDYSTGTRREGVQLVNLSRRIDAYDGAVVLRRILGNRSSAGYAALSDFYGQVHERPYERSTWELVSAALDGPWGAFKNQEDFSSLFCSELVAESLQRLGILSGDTPANEWTPSDLFEPHTPSLMPGFSWGEEIALKGPV